MSHSYSLSMDDDDPFSAPSPAVTSSDGVRLRDRPPTQSAATRQTSRHSGEWSSTRLSTSGSTSGGSGRRDTALPPTRQGVLKPEDTLKVDAFRLVKPESSPLSITAKETLSVLEKQKQAQKETRTYKNTDDDDIDWEQNLSSWKSRRKSKSSYQSKGLETEEGGGDGDMEESYASGKKSKTFKELMDQKEKRSNGHSMYTYDDNQDKPAATVETISASSSKRETQPTRADTKHHDDLPKQSEPTSSRVSSVTAKQSSTTASESHSTSRNNFTEAPLASTTRTTSGYISSEVGHGTRSTHSGTVPAAARDSDIESYSTSRYNLTEAPPPGKTTDGGGESYSTSSRYHTSEHVTEVGGHGTRPSSSSQLLLSDRSTSERNSEQRQKPFELTVDLQVQTSKPSTDSADLLQKKTTTTTTTTESSLSSSSVRPLHNEPSEARRTSWQAPSTKPKSDNYGVAAKTTTPAFEVQMREKPRGSEPPPATLGRPSSYAYTPSTSRQSDMGRPKTAREEATATGSVSNRNSLTGGSSGRPVAGVGTRNPSGLEGRARDRRAMSTFELNFEKSFRPPPKSVGVGGDVNASSSRFKQTLSLFQNKEAEGGGSGPVKAHPPPLGTQKSVGRISRPSGEGIKPSYSVVEMRRGSAAGERRYGESPTADTTSSSYRTDAARLRGVSRSVQGLDTYRSSDFSIPDSRSSVLSRDRSERYGGSRDFGRAEVSDGNSMETGSSRAHSSDEERERVPRNASGRSSADADKPLESRASLQIGLEADRKEVEPPTRRYDANGTSESAGGAGVKSSYSRSETLDTDTRSKVSGKIEADPPHRSITVSRYSSLYDTGVHDKPTSSYSTSTKTTTDWDKKPGSSIHRDDDNKQRMTVTSSVEIRNEPKELYAYKHRNPLIEESVIGSRDIGKQTAKHDETTRRHESPDRKSGHIESLKTDPAVRYDTKESYGRDEYKKPDAAPQRASYQEPEKPGLRGDPQRVGQQGSISDIFSKRSAAVIRGTSVGPETTEPHGEAALATSAGFTGRSAAERKMARLLENAVDDTIKEFQGADERTTRSKDDPSAATGAGDVTRAKTRHDQNEPSFQRTDYDVTTRTTRDTYGSERRHHGLERTSDHDDKEESLSHRKITLGERKSDDKSIHQSPAFEVNFSVSGVDNKPSRGGGDIKMGGKGNIESVAVDREKQERKSSHHEESSAFELNFSVSELERQRRLGGEDKTGKTNVGESLEKQNKNAELIRINDSLVVKTPKEEKRLADDHKRSFVIEEKIVTRDEKISLGDQRKDVGEDKKTHDSFHRPTESVARHVVNSDTKTVTVGDRESPKGHRGEFEIAIDTRGLYPSEKKAPAVTMSTEPKTLRSGVQQELILEFPDSKSKESAKREPVTDDFYFGMTGGTSEGMHHKAASGGRPAELVVEIPIPEEIRLSRVDRLPSQKDRTSSPEEHTKPPEEHKLPSHDHTLPSYEPKLPSYEPKLPTEEHKSKSQEPKTEVKTPSREQKLPTALEHRSSPLPSQESKSRPEEHKIPPPQEYKLLPPYQPKLPTEQHKLPPLEHKAASSKEQKRPSDEHIFPSHERKLPREERRSPPREPDTPPSEPEEERLPSPDHRLSPLPSPEHKPVEHKPVEHKSVEHKSVEHKSVEHKPVERKPVEHKGLVTKDEKPSPHSSSSTKTGQHVIDLDSHLANIPSTASDKLIIAELDTLLDGPRFDLNSNIPTDTKKTPPTPPRSTLIPKDETPPHDKTAQKTTVVAPPTDKSRTPDEPNGFLASSVLDGGDSATDDGAKTGSVPKKKPPPPPPKTKPKPNASKVSDAPPVEKDDWGFLSSSERLDVSVSKDKSRLLTTAPMGARRRPKSMMLPLLETSDPFDQSMTTDQNGPSKMEENGHGSTKLDGSDSDHTTHTPGSATPPTPLTAVEQLPPATRMKSKGVRPVSYMEELNSSLFKKKMKDNTETPSDDDDEAESKPPTSKHYKMEDITVESGEHSKPILRSSSSIRRKDEEDGKDEEQARELESPVAEKTRHGGGVKIPGLMDELNISFKKKRPENVGDSREEDKSTVEVATGDLLNFSDDKNDDEGEAPPPPLPNAPPPLPNWNAFPGSTSTDPLLPSGPPPGLPSGPPPGPPSGPPPSGQSLLDLSFSEDEPGQLHFRTTGLSVDQSHSQGKGKTPASDDMDFSFA